jgi:hypothetical protein
VIRAGEDAFAFIFRSHVVADLPLFSLSLLA